MHRKRPAFLTDMGLLMFLAVTASLLGYCQTDEKGKTERRDSRPPFAIPPSSPPFPYLCRPRPRRQRRKKYGFRFPRPPGGGGREAGENGAVRGKERRRLTFMAAGMSSSREFTYSGSGLTVTARTHIAGALLIVRETMGALHPARRPFVNTPARAIISGAPRRESP